MHPSYLKILLVMVLALVALMPPRAADHRRAFSQDELAKLPEVRLRKLHLVRPDLIPYPIFFEVYC